MIELILAAQIFLVTNVQCGEHLAQGCLSRYRNGDRVIQVQNVAYEWQKYWILYHEQGHNLMVDQYEVPDLFQGEEERANAFAFWLVQNKYPQNGSWYAKGSPEDVYFSAICKEDCVKAILDIDLSTYPVVDKIKK
jgi:hypothetical protein